MSRWSLILTEGLVAMVSACAVCFAQQHFDYTKPVNAQEADAELDAIKYKSLMAFLKPDPKSRIDQNSYGEVYFEQYNAVGDVGESSCHQRDLPNQHERCFRLLRIYHHLHAPSGTVAGGNHEHGDARTMNYWAISEAFQIVCEKNSIRAMGSVVYRETLDEDRDDSWNGGWEDYGYDRAAERGRPIDESDRVELLARDKLCKG